MEINVEKSGPCSAKVSIEIPSERVDEELDKNYKQTAQSVAFPGFRKGKAPRKLIIKRFGEIINNDVKEKLVQEAWEEAIDKHNLDPVGEPEIDLDSLQVKPGESLQTTITVEIKPEFELGEYKGLAIEVEPLNIRDEDVEESLRSIQSRFAALQPVEDQPVDKKHYLTLDLTYKIDGEEDLTREDSQANMALKIVDGVELKEEILENFVGKKLNDTVEYAVEALPEHFQPDTLSGKPAEVVATIKEIRAITIPEMDEELLKKIGVESEEELRNKIKEELLAQGQKKHQDDIESKLIDQLVQNHTIEVPEKLLMKQISDQERNLHMELLRMGVTEDKIKDETEKLTDKNREAAVRNLQASFIYDKIADKEKVFVTENEIEGELKVIAQQQNAPLDQVKDYYQEHNLTSSLRNFLRNQKIRTILRESAKIDEKESGSSSAEKGEAEGNDNSGDAGESETSA